MTSKMLKVMSQKRLKIMLMMMLMRLSKKKRPQLLPKQLPRR